MTDADRRRRVGDMSPAQRGPVDEAGRFTVRRTLDTSLSEAWRAWQDEATVRQWWGPTGFTCPRAEVDLRVGGSALVTMQAPAEYGGFLMHNRWRYTVVDEPTTIEFVSTFTDESGNDVPASQVGVPPGVPDEVPHRVSFAAAGQDRTELAITEWGYTTADARAQSQVGQEQVLDKLQALFATTSTGQF